MTNPANRDAPPGTLPDLRHEIKIPDHTCFAPAHDRQVLNRPWLIVSGPSRMGNHLLLSLLDGHPNLPAVPGEDGTLSFAFAAAARDPEAFFQTLADKTDSSWLRLFAANGHGDKWQDYAAHWSATMTNEQPSGVMTTEVPALFDYRAGAPEIAFAAFVSALDNDYQAMTKTHSFAALIDYYVTRLLKLLPVNQQKTDLRFDGLLCHSGMRSQCLWALDRFPNVVVLASVRPFESYAWSHLRSRYTQKGLTPDILDEAWSHWQNKLADYLAIKQAFPGRVHLVSYDDMITKTAGLMTALTAILSIPMVSDCLSPTSDGLPVAGNASHRLDRAKAGAIYQSVAAPFAFPKSTEAKTIWSTVYEHCLQPKALGA